MARLPSESAVPTRPPPPSEQDRHLVLVTGPGRSGTSAITGALGELGLEVPGPLVAANRTNPRGFYENRWVVDFQRDSWPGRAPMSSTATRPRRRASRRLSAPKTGPPSPAGSTRRPRVGGSSWSRIPEPRGCSRSGTTCSRTPVSGRVH